MPLNIPLILLEVERDQRSPISEALPQVKLL